jgi:integrase
MIQARGRSVQTTNYYLSHLKSFCRWLVKDRRTGDNPVAHLDAGNIDVDRRHDRRELEADELRRLLAVTRASGRTFLGLAGPARFALDATACGTGFRASALASLTPEFFDLGDAPTVPLAARENKSRKTKVQPLPPDVAALLRDYLAGKPAGRRVWGGTWAKDYKGAEMLRLDLEAAGIPYSVEGPDGPLYADFHALRHTYLTLGGRAGIDLRTLQELAGHSTPTLTARYSHRRLYDLQGAVEKLPRMLPEGDAPQAETLRATGTEGAFSCSPVAQTADSGRGSVRVTETDRGDSAPVGNPLQTLKMTGDEVDCDWVRRSERKEAPPGFEPGMADLQSDTPVRARAPRESARDYSGRCYTLPLPIVQDVCGRFSMPFVVVRSG